MQTEKINGRPREKTVFARQIKDQNNWICWHNRQTNQERKLDDAETRLAEIILCHFRFQTAVLSRRQIGEKREPNTSIKMNVFFKSLSYYANLWFVTSTLWKNWLKESHNRHFSFCCLFNYWYLFGFISKIIILKKFFLMVSLSTREMTQVKLIRL